LQALAVLAILYIWSFLLVELECGLNSELTSSASTMPSIRQKLVTFVLYL